MNIFFPYGFIQMLVYSLFNTVLGFWWVKCPIYYKHTGLFSFEWMPLVFAIMSWRIRWSCIIFYRVAYYSIVWICLQIDTWVISGACCYKQWLSEQRQHLKGLHSAVPLNDIIKSSFVECWLVLFIAKFPITDIHQWNIENGTNIPSELKDH